MCKFSRKSGLKRIDPCMRNYVIFLVSLNLIPRACCCGHGKYSKTVIIERTNTNGDVLNYELFTGRRIPRKKRFYMKDRRGMYFVPEIDKEKPV